MTRKNKFKGGRRLLSFLLALAMVLSISLPVLASDIDSDTIYINSISDLQEFAEKCKYDRWSEGKTIVLQTDLSLEGIAWEPIVSFGGTFVGNGHTISNVDVKGAYSPAGFFATVEETATITDLSIEGNVCPNGTQIYVGGLVGINKGTIENCQFSGTVKGSREVGGLVGRNETSGIIRGGITQGSVCGSNEIGGFVGHNCGQISEGRSICEVNTQYEATLFDTDGILASLLEEIQFNTETQTESLTNVPMDVGGIAGCSSGRILGCVNGGNVGCDSIGYNVGGIVGRTDGLVSDCTNQGKIKGRKDVGGIAGQLEPVVLRDNSVDSVGDLSQELQDLQQMLASITDSMDDTVNRFGTELDQVSAQLTQMLETAQQFEQAGNTYGEELMEDIEQIEDVLAEAMQRLNRITDTTGQSMELIASSKSLVSMKKSMEGLLDSAEQTNELLQWLSQQELTQITPPSEELKDSAGQMVETLKNLSSRMDGALHDLSGTAKQMSSDLKKLERKISAVTNSLMEVIEEFTENKNNSVLEDVSEQLLCTDRSWIGQSTNYGTVTAEQNTGGIVGTMAIENTLAPESDQLGDTDLQLNYTVSAVVKSCTNRGNAFSKKKNAGGICGEMRLGYINACESYAKVEGGNNVGGIAGRSSAKICSNWSKCAVSGENYLGGIVGKGVENTLTGNKCTVLNNYALVSVETTKDGAGQYLGAISGGQDGTFSGNFFVSDTLQGIDRANRAEQAEPITYQSLLETDDLPEEFRKITVRFKKDGELITQKSVEYGGSLSVDDYPPLPQKDGYYAKWDVTELNDLHLDAVVEVVYTPYIISLCSVETRTNGRPVFYVEGLFGESDVMSAVKEIAVLENAQEQWQLTMPSDGQEHHMVHYMPEDNLNGTLFMQQKDGSWTEVETEVFGSYLRFEAAGDQVVIAYVPKKFPVEAVVALVVGACAVICIAGAVKHKKEKNSVQKN